MSITKKSIIIACCMALGLRLLAFAEVRPTDLRGLERIGAFPGLGGQAPFRTDPSAAALLAVDAKPGAGADQVPSPASPAEDPYLEEKLGVIHTGFLVTGIGLGLGTAAALSALVFDFGGIGLGIAEIASVGVYTIGSVFMAFPYRDIVFRIDQGKLAGPKPTGALWGSAFTYGLGMGCLLSLGMGWGFLGRDGDAATAGFVLAGICHVGAIVSYVCAFVSALDYENEIEYSLPKELQNVSEAPAAGGISPTSGTPILSCSFKY